MENQDLQTIKNSLFIGDLIRMVQEELIESQKKRTEDDTPPLFEVKPYLGSKFRYYKFC